MNIIGFRNSPSQLRYAILAIDGNEISFRNASGEHALSYPKNIVAIPEKLDWLYKEVIRVLDHNCGIRMCALKCNEYLKKESKSTRYTSYADSIVMLACRMHNIPIEHFLYKQIQLTRSEVLDFAQNIAGKSDKLWNDQIADAIAVAYYVGTNYG